MPKKRKILFFCRLFYPHIGGVEKHVLEISKRLVAKGFEVTVLTENFDSLPEQDKIEGIKIFRVKAGREGRLKKFRVWLNLLKYVGLIASSDIVHCHDIFFWYLPFRFIFFSKPVFTTFHGNEGNEIPTKKSIFMHKIAEKLSSGNICVGDYLQKWYGTKPDITTYGAVNIPKNNRSNKRKSVKSALYIGRLEEEAGIMIYLQALKILKDKKVNLKLTVLGDGSQGKIAKEYAKKNNLDVEFKGFVSEVYKYLPNFDIVFSGRYLGVMESFVFKKFVFVVYNNAIKKDYFGLAPYKDFIAMEKDPNKLSVQIANYIKHPGEYTEKINGAYDWVKKQTWEKLVGQYIELWGL